MIGIQGTVALSIAILLSGLLSSCVTGRGSRGAKKAPVASEQEDDRLPRAKAGTKASEQDAAEGTVPSIGAARGPSLNAQLKFLRLFSRTGAPFGPSEHEFVATLPKDPKRGSVAEAALFVGTMSKVVYPVGRQAPTYEEEDLLATDGSNNDVVAKPSLQSQVQLVGLEPVEALKQNRWLQHYGVASLTMAALAATRDDPTFRAPIEAEIRRQAVMWSKYAPGYSPNEVEAAPAPEVNTFTDAPLSPADLKSGDSILMEAQTLAGRGRFRDAIAIASRIPEDDPMHPVAIEKIAQFSNQAVQDLRRKAAQAFQKAIPVSDRGARAAHLKEAQAYLQEAIQNYPTADQLPTVRNNLEVISRDLERLNEESGEEDNDEENNG